jgi:hypothetical protein
MKVLNEKIETLMFKRNIPAEQIVVVTGDIACSYKEIFWRYKLYGIDWAQIEAQITLKSRYGKEDLHWVFNNRSSKPLVDKRLREENFVIELWNRPTHLFSAFTGSQSVHSNALVSELMVRNLLERGTASYNIFNNNRSVNPDYSEYYSLKAREPYVSKKREALESLNNTKTILDVDGDMLFDDPYRFHKSAVQDTAFSIICDKYAPISKPKFLAEINTLWVTSTVWRHIAMGHPFLLLGSLNTINYLNQEGYFSFNHLFNDMYDRTAKLPDRVNNICDQIEKLGSLSTGKLNELIQETKQYLIANRKRFYGKNNSVKFKRLFEEMKYEHF